MKNKYPLYIQESLPGTNVLGSENIQNKLIKLAVNNGCFTDKGFKKGAFKDLKSGKTVMYKKSDNKKLVDQKRNYIFILPEDDGISFTVEYRDRPDEQGKVVKSKSGIRCKTIKQTTDPALTPDQADIIKFLKQNGFQNYTEVTPEQWANKSLVDIYKDADVIELMKDKPELLQQIQSNKDRVFWMWKGSTSVSGLKGDFEDKSKKGQEFVDFLIKNGWKKPSEITPELNPKYNVYDLSDSTLYTTNSLLYQYVDYAKFFQKGYLMYEPKASKTTKELNQIYNLEIENAKVNYDRKSCRNVIIGYYDEWRDPSKKFPTSGSKEVVEQCLSKNAGKYPGLVDIIDTLRLQLGESPKAEAFKIKADIDYKTKPVRESDKENLKNIISESLHKVKLNKKKLLSESSIVRSRLQVLVENRDLRRKKDLDGFFDDFLTETAYLNSKGYNQEIISEQFFDMLKGFFGGTGLDSVFGYFKEYATKWLLNKLGVDTSGWVGTVVSTAIGNLPLGDIPKLTDCNYVVPYLAKTIAESAAAKFMETKGVANPLTSVLRNAITEMVEDTAFGQAIENGLRKLVCPLLDTLKGKMSNVTSNIKDKALGDSEKEQAAPAIGAGNSEKGLASML